jgi:hypothetical protein
VLVSKDNTIHVPAANSVKKNSIKVDILSDPPFWATRYKFALLPSGLDYETIYSSLYFLNPGDGSVYLNLEGNNQNKTKVGDTLIVKRDSNGPILDLVKCDVLDIVAKPEDFIEGGAGEPAGLYMKVKPIGFSIDTSTKVILGNETFTSNFTPFTDPSYPAVSVPLFTEDPVGTFTPWEITEGSIIEFDIVLNRPDKSNKVGQRRYSFKKQFIAASNYNNLYDFANAQNIPAELPKPYRPNRFAIPSQPPGIVARVNSPPQAQQ